MIEILYLVEHKSELPSINKITKLQNTISGEVQSFKVKKIKDLKWNNKGDLIITMCGEYL